MGKILSNGALNNISEINNALRLSNWPKVVSARKLFRLSKAYTA